MGPDNRADQTDRSPVAAGEQSDELASIAESFRHQRRGMRPRAPLYEAICECISRNDELLALLLRAPVPQRFPTLLLASVHAVLLDEPDDPLARWYPNLSVEPRSPTAERGALEVALCAFCRRHGDAIAELCATRSTQTNEIGRCALFVPVFALLAREVGELAHLDVGTSAGLNLLWDRYRYRYEPGGTVGPASSVVLTCGTRGAVPIPSQLPTVAARLGIDRKPVDLADPAQTRWLEACVWPDQWDRFARLRAAIAMSAGDPPHVRRGDAVTDLEPAIGEIDHRGHPVVTNSWVLNYLAPGERQQYLATLEAIGAQEDLSWLFAESPALVPELPVAAVLDDPATRDQTVLTLVRWRGGERRVDHLARCHPHGYWLHWRGRDA